MPNNGRDIIAEVERAVANDDLAALDHMAESYFKEAPAGPEPFSAALQLTERGRAAVGRENLEALAPVEESALALNAANAVERARRLLKYRRKKRREPDTPRIVAEGDSWFQYPFLLHDVIDVLMDKYAVNCLCGAGDTVENMIRSGEYLEAIAAERPAVFVFSGGGNDLVGDGKLRPMLRPFRAGDTAAQHIDDRAFMPVLDGVMQGFRTIVRAVARTSPGLKVLSHGYDHPINLKKGPWIWPFMEEKNIPLDMAQRIVAEMLDRFNARLAELARTEPNFVHVNAVGSVGGTVGDWHDALHPEDPGYGRAAQRFIAAIDRLLPAPADDHREGVALRAGGARGERPGVVPPSPRKADEELPSSARAIRAIYILPNAGYPVWEDFGSESGWLRFDDPDARTQIKEVISLLKRREVAEAADLVENRIALRSSGGAPARTFPEALGTEGMQEAIIGTNDLEQVQTLLQGYRASKAAGLIALKQNFGGYTARGTGFLVGPGLLLTNHHVLRSADYAARCVLTMDDERSLTGDTPLLQRFRITPDLYYASEALDFAFVSVEPRNAAGKALADYGSFELISTPGKAIKGEAVSIIQHADGQPKTVSLRNSIIMGRVGDGIYYTSDTQGGSSGSAVVNLDWQVVALHHRNVPHPTIPDEHIANRGVRISAILEHIEKDSGGNADAKRVRDLIGASSGAGPGGGGGAPVGEPARPPAEAAAAAAPVLDGAYQGLTEAELLAAIGRADDPEGDAEAVPAGAAEALAADPASVERRIGANGVSFIIGHEVSSPAEYDRRFRNPILPGAQSGITIGIGYDLGHHTLAELNQHWHGLLPAEALARLARCIGKKRPAAVPLLAQVRDIDIPYAAALEVFKRATLPKYFKLLDDHIDDAVLEDLPPDCVAALVSLTFNRGASYASSGPRYSEMRDIKKSMNTRHLARVPGLIRSMKRLWTGLPNVRGLLRRRDEEAALFEAGLASLPHEHAERARYAADAAAGSDDDPDPETRRYSAIDGDEESELDRAPRPAQAVTEAASARRRLTLDEVGWVRNYASNPDYRHLPEGLEGASFHITPPVLEQLIAAGRYQPHFTAEGDLIVAVRGARIESGEEVLIERPGIRLTEQKPDHRAFRCTMLVYNKARGVLSAFKASTVPNRGGVVAQYNKNAGFPGVNANMLPTGCYELCVGTHFGEATTIPTVLRLGTGPGPAEALRVTTLRTLNDGVYGTQDFWDACKPMDNIHPAFQASSADFSSLGCLTIPGRYAGGRHQGNWARFRDIARFNTSAREGTRYNLVLTTGMELAAIAAAAGEPGALGDLVRLSHGSQGHEVTLLQRALGIVASGSFDADTKKALSERERARLAGNAAGIYSMRSERELGLGVFGP